MSVAADKVSIECTANCGHTVYVHVDAWRASMDSVETTRAHVAADVCDVCFFAAFEVGE